jgi:hypothetical protein
VVELEEITVAVVELAVWFYLHVEFQFVVIQLIQ